jgi:hypothetical protein
MTQPENTVPSVPQSVAEEDSVLPANEALRETLRRRSDADQQGGQQEQGQQSQQQEPSEEAAPAKRASARKTADDE